MIDKSKIRILIAILSVSILLFFILHFCFKAEYCNLLYEISLASFTGILFIVPSYIFNIYRNHVDTNDIYFSLLCKLQICLNSISVGYDFNTIEYENQRRSIVKYHDALINIRKKYFFSDEKTLDHLLDNVFKISIMIKQVSVLANQNQNTNEVLQISELKDECNLLIETIKKSHL